jgi:hypothetical protein
MRAELDLITAGFDKLPALSSGVANELVAINSSGTGLTTITTLPTLTVNDSAFTVQDNADNTRKFKFEASGITAGATRTFTMPDATTTLVGTDTTQTLTNKTLTSPTISSPTITGTISAANLTLTGNTTLGDTTADSVTINGLLSSNLLFVDNTYDIGAVGATRPRNLYLSGSATVNGNVTLGDASSDTVTVNGTVTSNLIFTDNTYDIGASGATRPRNLFLAGNATVAGNTTIGDADTDTITQAASYVTGTQLKSAKTATNTLSLAAYDVDGTAYTDLITLTASNTPTLALTSTGVGTINNMSIGATTASTGAFTTLSSTGNTTLGDASADAITVNGTVTSNLIFTDNTYDIGASGATRPRTGYFGTSVISPLVDATNLEVTNLKALDGTAAGSIANSTGVVTLASSVLTTTDINGGTIDGTAIGGSTAAAGAFTTLTSNGATTFTAGTASTSTTTGTAVITGGLGVSGRINAANFDGIVGANTAAAGAFTTLSATGVTTVQAGTAAAPAITTTGDTNTGIFFPAADTVAISAGGTNKAQFGTGSATIDGLTVGRGAGAVSTNTAVGASALAANTSGATNTAFGDSALLVNTGGARNTGIGYASLSKNTTGSYNTGVGAYAGEDTSTGSSNSFFGYDSGARNTSGTGNTAIGSSALNANTTASYNTAVGYNAMVGSNTGSYNNAFGGGVLSANTSGTENNGFGYWALLNNTTGRNNSAFGEETLRFNTTGSYNTAYGSYALYANTTASNNTAVGYQALYTNTTGIRNVAVGDQAGQSITTGSYNTFVGDDAGFLATTGTFNTFIGQGSGEAVTTGGKNTILGKYSGNQGGLDIRTASNYIVLSDGDGNPRLQYLYGSSTSGNFTVASHSSANSTNSTFIVYNASGPDVICEAGNFTSPAISGVIRAAKIASNNRSINAAGTVNQNGADYAEYMVKSGSFTIAKGDVCGINAEGKLTNAFADAISFCVKSTDPGLVGGDSWFTEPRPKDENNNELTSDTQEYAAWFARMEAARATVDRIAFCGQVPVNVLGATSGQYIVPVNDNGAIKGEAVSNPTFEQYQTAVGKVIAIESDGRAKIIVKVA